jgi:hypothetical protein
MFHDSIHNLSRLQAVTRSSSSHHERQERERYRYLQALWRARSDGNSGARWRKRTTNSIRTRSILLQQVPYGTFRIILASVTAALLGLSRCWTSKNKREDARITALYSSLAHVAFLLIFSLSQPYDLPDKATSWRCANCMEFNSITAGECPWCTVM